MKPPLGKMISFYGTWVVLALRAIFIVAFLIIVLVQGVRGFLTMRPAGLRTGVLCSLVEAAGAYMFFRSIQAFRSAFRTGIKSELKRRHFCPDCGYDLRKSVETCPECGYQILKTIEL